MAAWEACPACRRRGRYNGRPHRFFPVFPPIRPSHARSPDRGPRRAGAQSPRRHRRPAAGAAGLSGGGQRVRKVEPGVRHALRRGAAAVCREPVDVRPPVPRPTPPPRRRQRDGTLPLDLHRPEVSRDQPPLDGGDDDGDPRLPPRPLCACRPGPLPAVRRGARGPAARRDRRADHRRPPGAPRARPRAAGARCQGGAPRPVHRSGAAGIHPRPRRWSRGASRGSACAREAPQAHDRGRRRPAGARRGIAEPTGRGGGIGAAHRRRDGDRRARRRGWCADDLE